MSLISTRLARIIPLFLVLLLLIGSQFSLAQDAKQEKGEPAKSSEPAAKKTSEEKTDKEAAKPDASKAGAEPANAVAGKQDSEQQDSSSSPDSSTDDSVDNNSATESASAAAPQIETASVPDEWFDNTRWFSNVDDQTSVFEPLDAQFGQVVVNPVASIFFYDVYYFDNSKQTVFGSVANLKKAISDAQAKLNATRVSLGLDPPETKDSEPAEPLDLTALRNGLKSSIQAALASILSSKEPTPEIKQAFLTIKNAFFQLDFELRNSQDGALTKASLITAVKTITPAVNQLSDFTSQTKREIAWTLCPDLTSGMRTSYFRGFNREKVEALISDSGYRDFEADLEYLVKKEKLVQKDGAYSVVQVEVGEEMKDVSFTAITIPFIVAWLVAGAIYFTIRMTFINIRGFKHAIRVTKGDYDNPDDPGEISHFQALSSALSATVGLGNIAGVAIAVSLGGPGAIVWMVIAGFLGMTSKFTECTLGQMYRKVDEEGQVLGGPMRYLSAGLSEMKLGWLGKILAVMFVILCIGGSFGGGNMFQANQSYAAVKGAIPWFDGKAWLYGIILAFLVGLVILGGIKRIGTAAGVIVPFMCLIYVVAGLFVILVNTSEVPRAFLTMFAGAFNFKAGLGGFVGVLVVGFQRAAFSNEAGTGSASIAHSAAATDEPVREGIVALLEPFIDTIVVCTMTGLVVVITEKYQIEGVDGVEMTSLAFASVIPWFPYVLSVAVVLFAFSTMISWSYYGERCAIWLFGDSASVPYKFLFLIFVFLGAVLNLGNVLGFSDLMILGMAFPNILGLVLLSGKVRRALTEYEEKLEKGEFSTKS